MSRIEYMSWASSGSARSMFIPADIALDGRVGTFLHVVEFQHLPTKTCGICDNWWMRGQYYRRVPINFVHQKMTNIRILPNFDTIIAWDFAADLGPWKKRLGIEMIQIRNNRTDPVYGQMELRNLLIKPDPVENGCWLWIWIRVLTGAQPLMGHYPNLDRGYGSCFR